MKNIFAILLALALAFTLPLTALAEGATPTDLATPGDLAPSTPNTNVPEYTAEPEVDPYAAQLMGLLMGWNDDGAIMIRDDFGQLYQVNIDPDTTNMEDAQFLAVGDYVTVLYDGRLSRSIPAQLTASYVSCFQRTGVVSQVEYDEETDSVAAFYLTIDGEECLYVDMQDCMSANPVYEGNTVTVYFNGMMSRSIPAHIFAQYTRTIHLAGQILEVGIEGEDLFYILVNDETLGEVQVWCDADTILYNALDVGEMVAVATTGMMAMSNPAQMWALEVFSMAVPAM